MPDHLYIIQSDVTGAIKIGRSKQPNKRLKQLQTGSPYDLKLLLVLEGKGDLEKSLHRMLEYYRFRSTQGEWFDFEATGNLPIWICEQIDWEEANTWWEEVKVASEKPNPVLELIEKPPTKPKRKFNYKKKGFTIEPDQAHSTLKLFGIL